MGSTNIISLFPLFLAVPSLNLGNIKRKILGKAENGTRGCWVRSKYATSVLSSLPPLSMWPNCLKQLCLISGTTRWPVQRRERVDGESHRHRVPVAKSRYDNQSSAFFLGFEPATFSCWEFSTKCHTNVLYQSLTFSFKRELMFRA